MFPSIFTDELALDITEALPVIKSWGLDHVDLRGRVFGKAAEALPADRLPELRKLLEGGGMSVGCLESSLAKVHLPGAERQAAEAEKLEGLIRAADALDCRLVRSFFFWQPADELKGALAVRPDEQQRVLDLFAPLAERARAAGLVLAFENCGVTPDEVFTMLDMLDVPAWGLAWDVCNTWSSDERRADEDGFLIRMARRARLVHVKARGAVEGADDELIPYDKVLLACHNAGVAWPVSAETHNPDRAVSNVDMSRRVVEVIQKAWPTAAAGGLFDTFKPKREVQRAWKDNPVGFAVVGLGMGHVRSKEIVDTPGVKLIGVCDLDADRARRTADECGVPGDTDMGRWLADPAVEAVFVLPETGRHGELALRALEAGKHVITTKPMDDSLAACDEMILAAEAAGKLLAVDFSRRFSPGLLSLKAAVDAGRFGRLLSGTVSLKIQRTMEYFRSNGGWRGTRRLDGGGVLSNQAIHHIDEMVFAVGVPDAVKCSLWTLAHEIEAEDLAAAVWRYDDGPVINLNATTNYPQPTWYVNFELEGAAGAYHLAAGGPVDRSDVRWLVDGAWSPNAPETLEPEWLNSMDNLAAAVRVGAPLVCDGREGRRTQAVLDAMYRSAYDADGGWVAVSPELD